MKKAKTTKSKGKTQTNIELTNRATSESSQSCDDIIQDNSIIAKIDRTINYWNHRITFFASFLAIVTFIASVVIIYSYITPYVASTEVIRDYTPEDYIMGASLEIPNYVLKTTEIVVIKPSYFSYIFSNSKTFSLPNDSFAIKVSPTDSDKYTYKFDINKKNIVFYFLESRFSVENIEISFSYKQFKNPTILLLDYTGEVGSNTIEENLILENKENAKITSYRGNWIINDNETDWLLDKIQNNPDFILVDGNRIHPLINRTSLNNTKVLIYSWDMNFEENEIKNIKIVTNTSVNYSAYSANAELIRKEPAFEVQFPFREGNFEWVIPAYLMEKFPFPNDTGYFNGSGILIFPFPYNTTSYKNFYQDYLNQGKVLK